VVPLEVKKGGVWGINTSLKCLDVSQNQLQNTLISQTFNGGFLIPIRVTFWKKTSQGNWQQLVGAFALFTGFFHVFRNLLEEI